LLVYSIASRNTFERLETFRQSMIRVKKRTPVFMLVGNKCDKSHEREVSPEEGEVLAKRFGCHFVETSAKTAHGVEQVFSEIVRSLREARGGSGGGSGGGGGGGKSSEKGAREGGNQQKKKRKCVIM
jgi:GTPase KRas